MTKSFYFLLFFTLYISIANAQIITTIAGTGINGYSGDGGAATAAELYIPQGIAIDRFNNLYIADTKNNRIRKITPAGLITTIAGTGSAGFSGDGGAATAAKLNFPSQVAIDALSNIYISDHLNERVRKIDATGNITTVAGNGGAGSFTGDGGPATDAPIQGIYNIAIDSSGLLYIAGGYNRIRIVNTFGIITTFAGITDTGGFSGDGGPATAARLDAADGVWSNSEGSVFIADGGNQRIRSVNNAGIINTIAGSSTYGYCGDGGEATTACLNTPYNVTTDVAGNVYVADGGDNRIRKVDVSGIITTVAGNGTGGYSGDGGQATNAEIYNPSNVVTDSAGNLYIADRNNNRIRFIQMNRMPSFTSGPEYLTLCAIESFVNIDSFMAITDADTGQSEIWTVSRGPAHGALSGFPDTVTSTGGVVTPTGLIYSISGGYAGHDTFTIQICDGHAIKTKSIYVTILPYPNAGTITGADSVCVGATVALTDTASGGTWSSSNTGIATVNTTGLVGGVAAGLVTIRYSVSDSCGADTSSFAMTVKSHAACTAGVETVQPSAPGIAIYPNPNNGSFIFQLHSLDIETATITVTDVLGQKVKEMTIQTNKETEIQLHVHEGVYLVSAVLNGLRVSERLVVD